MGPDQSVKARLLVEWESIASTTQQIRLSFDFKIKKDWHLYWKNPGKVGLPPRTEWTLPKNWSATSLFFPKHETFLVTSPEENYESYGYKNEVAYSQILKGPGTSVDTFESKVVLKYLVCNLQCIPGKAEWDIKIPVEGEKRSIHAVLIDEHFNKLPAEEMASLSTSEETKDRPFNFAWMLLFAFIGGLILNLMPCVLPVLMLKSVSLISQNKKGKRGFYAWTAIGIISSLLFLGALTAGLQSLGHQIGWGFQFQSPVFLITLIIILLLFAAVAIDLIQFPQVVLTGNARWLSSPFAEGVLVTLLSTPCTAPFLGTAMGFALSQPPLFLLSLFLTMGLGLSTPYWLLEFFPQALTLLPKPGAWMLWLKRIMALSLIVTALWLASVLSVQFKPKELSFPKAEIEKQIEMGENLFIHISADWCLTCQVNERSVIQKSWFKDLLQKHNVKEIKGDWTSPDPAITEFLKSYQRSGIPFSMLAVKGRVHIFSELLTEKEIRSVFEKEF